MHPRPPRSALRASSRMTIPTPKDTALRLGILGCANIARQFARDVAPSPAVRIVAVASRNAGHRGGLRRRPTASAATTAATRRCWPTRMSTPSTCRCRTACMPNGRSRRSNAASTCCARSRWRSAWTRRRRCSTPRGAHRVMLLEAYPYYFQPQTARHAGAAARRRDRRRALGAGELRLHAGQPAEQHPHEARAGRRRAARRGQLRAERDPPGDGVRAAARAGRCELGRQRRRHQPDGDAALRRRPPRAAVLRDGRGQPPPRHHRRHERHDRDRIPEPHQRAGRRPSLRLPAEPAARASRHREHRAVRRDPLRHRQRLPLCRRGLCQGGGRSGISRPSSAPPRPASTTRPRSKRWRAARALAQAVDVPVRGR